MMASVKKNLQFCTLSLLNFTICFMVCVFAPLDVYFANIEEFWFGVCQLLPICGIALITTFLILEVFSYLLCGTRIASAIIAMVIGVVGFFYIQGNLIPRDYGVLDGRDIDWSAYTSYGLASICTAGACLLAVVFLFFKFRNRIVRVGWILGAAILLIQIITIFILATQNGLSGGRSSEKLELSNEDIFELAHNNNVIVFILDTYDQAYFEQLLEEDSVHQTEIFRNFTFYKDTLGSYPTTKAALPFILTGKWYKNEEPYLDYVNNAYTDNPIYESLRDNKWEVEAYVSSYFISQQDKVFGNTIEGDGSIGDRLKFATKLYKLIGFNYMPHQLKRFFLISTSDFSSEAGNTIKTSEGRNTVGFADDFKKKGVALTKSNNLFKVYHLDGVHSPYTFGKNLEEDGGNYTAYDEAYGNNELLSQYFEALKQAGVYDKSTIIVMADHGHEGYSQNPIFLIKNRYENHEFVITKKKMSWAFLSDIWKTLAQGKTIDETFIAGCLPENGERRFLFYQWDDTWEKDYLPGMEEFSCRGVAYKSENMRRSGRRFLPENGDYSYTFGKPLEMISGRAAYDNVLYGVAYGELCKEAQFVFDFVESYNNICVEIALSKYSQTKEVTVVANDKVIANKIFTWNKDGKIRFLIPQEYVLDGHLKLTFIVGETTYSDSVLAKTGVVIDNIVLTSTEETVDLEKQTAQREYVLGRPLSFTLDENSGGQYIVDGFSVTEEWGTWTSGNEAKLRFKIKDNSKDLKLRLDYWIFNDAQRVKVYVNNNLLEEYTAIGTPMWDFVSMETKEITIPKALLGYEGEYLDIKFELPDAIAPDSVDSNSDDLRLLALGFTSMLLDYK